MGEVIEQNESMQSYEFRNNKFQTLKSKVPSFSSEWTSDWKGGLWKVLDTKNPKQKMVVSKKSCGDYSSYHVIVLNVSEWFSNNLVDINKLYNWETTDRYSIDASKSFWMYQKSDTDPISICRYGEASSCIAHVYKNEPKSKKQWKYAHLVYQYDRGDNPEDVCPGISTKLETYASVIDSIDTHSPFKIVTDTFKNELAKLLWKNI